MTARLFTGTGDLRLRMTLLISQSFALGYTLSIGFAIANSLFLEDFGAQALPYTYIALAVFGSAVSFGFASLQKRYSLPQLSLTTIAGFCLFFFLAWIGLVWTSASWISFALVVVVPLLIQVGFIVLGSQAGRLLDVRQIKQLFPWVVTGFVVGFLVGGLMIPTLLKLLGVTENLLVVIAISSLLFVFLIGVTARRFAEAINNREGGQKPRAEKSLQQLLAVRFVLLIFTYQLLATMITQLGDYILLTQAGSRFSTAEELTNFFGSFTVWVNSADLLFLFLIAGFFMKRYGLRAGLLANPVILVAIFLTMVISGTTAGTATTWFFILAVVTRITNITLTDGTTRASMNATYQAMPAQDRVMVQTGVEGIGSPLALGMVGLILLIITAISGVTIVHVVALALMIGLAWSGLAILVYRGYAVALLHALKQRVLGPAELDLDDDTSLSVIEKLFHSGDLNNARLSLDVLQNAGHPLYLEYVKELAKAPEAEIRAFAFRRIELEHIESALSLVDNAVQHEPDSAAKGASIQAFCALLEADAVPAILPFLDDPRHDVERAALVGLLRYGSIPGIMAAGSRLSELGQSSEAESRRLAAFVIGDVGVKNFYQPLLPLLKDADPSVRQAALLAAGKVRHPRLLAILIQGLKDIDTRSAAIQSALAYGDDVMPFVDWALKDPTTYTKKEISSLVRLSGQICSQATIKILLPHLEYPDGEIRRQILTVLNLCGYQADPKEVDIIRQMLRDEARLASWHLSVGRDLGEADGIAPLLRALDEASDQARVRITLLLTFLYDAKAIAKAFEQLSSVRRADQAMAVELLEVTLKAEERRFIFPLIDPNIRHDRRLQSLAREFDVEELTIETRLQQLIADDRDPWIQACAIYAAGKLSLRSCLPYIAEAKGKDDPVVQETAEWAFKLVSSIDA